MITLQYTTWLRISCLIINDKVINNVWHILVPLSVVRTEIVCNFGQSLLPFSKLIMMDKSRMCRSSAEREREKKKGAGDGGYAVCAAKRMDQNILACRVQNGSHISKSLQIYLCIYIDIWYIEIPYLDGLDIPTLDLSPTRSRSLRFMP